MAEDFNSKYSGEQVEELLDQVASGNTGGGGGGGITVETDPIFSASPAASITEEKIAEWDNKVDKVDGKQLSTEDFTTTLKNKLNGLSNYDDTTIGQAIEKLRTDLDTLVSGDATTAIKTFNEVIAFLDGISDTEDLSSIIASIEQQIAGKMDSVTLAKVATSGSYEDLTDKPTIPTQVTIDSSVSSTSTNPVQNKVVKSYIDSNCNIPVSTTTSTSISLSPNRYYRWTNTPTSITITLATPSDSTILNNYMFEFTASSSGTTLTMPSSIKWMNGNTPTIEGGKTYQVSIINNLATVSKYG